MGAQVHPLSQLELPPEIHYHKLEKSRKYKKSTFNREYISEWGEEGL